MSSAECIDCDAVGREFPRVAPMYSYGKTIPRNLWFAWFLAQQRFKTMEPCRVFLNVSFYREKVSERQVGRTPVTDKPGLRELITEGFALAGVELDRDDNARSSKSRSGDQRFLRAGRSAQPRNHPQKNIAELW